MKAAILKAFGSPLAVEKMPDPTRTFTGWVAYHEPVPLIRHDVTGWEPIEDQAAVVVSPVAKVRRRSRKPVVVGRCWRRRADAAELPTHSGRSRRAMSGSC
jgi:hypothetical protein